MLRFGLSTLRSNCEQLVYTYHGSYVFHTAAVTDNQIHSHGLHNYVTSAKTLCSQVRVSAVQFSHRCDDG
jgi:hypothetical protein